MLTAIREVQIPLLAAMLLGACLARAWRAATACPPGPFGSGRLVPCPPAALIAFLSPELSEIMVRLGYSEPCELRRMPVGRTMSALHASSQWRRYAGQVSAGTPSDVWRERYWRFVVYPGYARGRPVDIVFAVYLQSRRPAVRAAVLDADTDEVLGPTGTRESAVL
jgi:hypothetical protein